MKILKKILFISIFCLWCVVMSRCIFQRVYYHDTGEKSVTKYIKAYNKVDAPWYNSIVVDGYLNYPIRFNYANFAFFPALPIILRVLTTLFHTTYELIGPIMNTFILWVACIIAYFYLKNTRNKRIAIVFTLLMTFGMYTFYYSSTYSESLFFLCTVIFFYALMKRKYLLMGLIGAVASATRAAGVFLVLALIPHAISLYREENDDKKFQIKDFLLFCLKKYQMVLGACMVPLGLFLFMFHLYHVVGDGFAFVRAQYAWGTSTISEAISTFLKAFMNMEDNDFFYAMWALFGLVSDWYLWKNKRFEEAIVLIVWVLMPLSVRLQSMPRYMVGSFFPIVVASEWIGKRNKTEICLICFFILLMSIGLYKMWINIDFFVV